DPSRKSLGFDWAHGQPHIAVFPATRHVGVLDSVSICRSEFRTVSPLVVDIARGQYLARFPAAPTRDEVAVRRWAGSPILRVPHKFRGYLLEFREHFPVARPRIGLDRDSALRAIRLFHQGDVGAYCCLLSRDTRGGTGGLASFDMVRLRAVDSTKLE